MTYTTQQLQGMSDHTINHALYHKLFQAGVNMPDITPDYCNNPNDIMPLAFERGIKLDCVACPAGSGFIYCAKSYDGELQSDYDSACRAIACLLLLMED